MSKLISDAPIYDPNKNLKDNIKVLQFYKECWHEQPANKDNYVPMPPVVLFVKDNKFQNAFLFPPGLSFDLIFNYLHMIKTGTLADRLVIAFDALLNPQKQKTPVEEYIIKYIKNLYNKVDTKEAEGLWIVDCDKQGNTSSEINPYVVNSENNSVLWKDLLDDKSEKSFQYFVEYISQIMKSDDSFVYQDIEKNLKSMLGLSMNNMEAKEKEEFLFKTLCSYVTMYGFVIYPVVEDYNVNKLKVA